MSQNSTENLTATSIKHNVAQFYYRDENAPKPNKPNHIGTAVIIEYQDKILMEHRTDSETWAVIGGGLWLNESLAECATREVFEETGIKLYQEDILFYKIYDDPSRIICYPDGNVLRTISVVYKVKLKNEPELKCSSESRELKFFSKEALKDITIANTHIPIIQDYQNGIFIPEGSI